jgi:chromosome partitioning protein
MTKVISVANQKGGTGKTSTVGILGIGLAMKGKKVLIIDLDSQGNLTSSIGENKNEFNETIYDCLVKEIPLENVIFNTNFENLYISPANIKLSNAEAELLTKIGRENILKRVISKLNDKLDFILIDCPPSLGVLSVNALVASNSVIIPIEASEFSLSGMEQFLTVFELVKNINPHIEIEGILLTRVEQNTNSFKKCYEQLKDIFKDKCYPFFIPRNQAVADAQFGGNFHDGKAKPCIYSNPLAKASIEYQKLVEEVLKND